MVLAKDFDFLSSSCLPAVIPPLSNQAASGPGKLFAELMLSLTWCPQKWQHQQEGLVKVPVNQSLSIRHCTTHLHNLEQQCHLSVRAPHCLSISQGQVLANNGFHLEDNVCKSCRCNTGWTQSASTLPAKLFSAPCSFAKATTWNPCHGKHFLGSLSQNASPVSINKLRKRRVLTTLKFYESFPIKKLLHPSRPKAEF